MKGTPFLMFQDGRAEEAMRLYVSLFPDGRIAAIDRYGADGPGPEGTVRLARCHFAGLTVMASDSHVRHGFDFTPSLSLFVDCDEEEQLRALVASLGEGGKLLMPLADYGFSRQFAWLNDRFGVSWQLNLP